MAVQVTSVTLRSNRVTKGFSTISTLGRRTARANCSFGCIEGDTSDEGQRRGSLVGHEVSQRNDDNQVRLRRPVCGDQS